VPFDFYAYHSSLFCLGIQFLKSCRDLIFFVSVGVVVAAAVTVVVVVVVLLVVVVVVFGASHSLQLCAPL
jgi:hypothetical protein